MGYFEEEFYPKLIFKIQKLQREIYHHRKLEHK